MIKFKNEQLKILHATGMLESNAVPSFNAITRTALIIAGTPICIISLIDTDKQWFASIKGHDLTHTLRNISFCTHTLESGEPLIVENAEKDYRFMSHPLVTGHPNLRFYAGFPLKSLKGYSLGTLCVIDTKPRKLRKKKLSAVKDLAYLATQEIHLREKLFFSNLSIENSVNTFNKLFESVDIGIAMAEPNGRLREVNEGLCNILGYTKDELLSLGFRDITFPDDLNTYIKLFDQLDSGKVSRYQLEKRCIQRNGDLIWIALTVTKHLKESGEIDYYSCIFKNIQSSKETELALAALKETLEEKVSLRTTSLQIENQLLSKAFEEKVYSEEKSKHSEIELKAVLNNANDAYVSMDLDGIVTSWNKQAEIIFGWLEFEAKGKRLDELIIPEEFREAHQKGLARFAAQRTSQMIGKRLQLEAIKKMDQEYLLNYMSM